MRDETVFENCVTGDLERQRARATYTERVHTKRTKVQAILPTQTDWKPMGESANTED
jgi:hypothetical protein